MKSKYENKPRKLPQQDAARKTADKKSDLNYLFPRAWEVFLAFLKARGDRVTQTRRIVLEHALGRKDHFKADDLAGDLAGGVDRVSRGTVYRTLALLVQAGIVREIRDTDTHAHFEPVFDREPHEHMICDECGKFIEFIDQGLAGHIDRACAKQKFSQRIHRVVVFGLCKDCKG
jgi:Fur family ferric uptake transcriptional regulator